MGEAHPTSPMAIFVLMAILLTAVTTTATHHHSPHHAVEGRDVPDKATEDRDVPDKATEDRDVPDVTTEDRNVLDETTEDRDVLDETSEDRDVLDETTEDRDVLDETSEDRDVLDEATEDRDVLDEATEDRVSRWRSAAESHHGSHDDHHVAGDDSGRPLQKASHALRDTQKRSSCSRGKVLVGIEIQTSSYLFSGTDCDVLIKFYGPCGEESGFYDIDDPNADDFERRSRKGYWYCITPFGSKLSKIALKLYKSGYSPNWGLSWIKVRYQDVCYYVPFDDWIDSYNIPHYLYPNPDLPCQ